MHIQRLHNSNKWTIFWRYSPKFASQDRSLCQLLLSKVTTCSFQYGDSSFVANSKHASLSNKPWFRQSFRGNQLQYLIYEAPREPQKKSRTSSCQRYTTSSCEGKSKAKTNNQRSAPNSKFSKYFTIIKLVINCTHQLRG